MIGEGYFDKGEEEHFQDRMNNVDKRMQNLLEHSQRDQEKWVKSPHRILVYYPNSFSVVFFVKTVLYLDGGTIMTRLYHYRRGKSSV